MLPQGAVEMIVSVLPQGALLSGVLETKDNYLKGEWQRQGRTTDLEKHVDLLCDTYTKR